MSFAPEIKGELIEILGAKWVKDDPVTLFSYRSDALTLHPAPPMGVIYPGTTDELVACVKLFHHNGISFVPRGAGTGLSGGAIPRDRSVVVEMFRFNTIEEIDVANRTAVVGPGVVNLAVTKAAAPHGLYFVPDPSSQKACTVGGNVGENSGGPHTLKYGVTVNHVLGLEMVLPDGELVRLGGKAWGVPGPDLLGLVVGSEGTFGIVTKVTCRLTPIPEKALTMLGVFESVADACRTVSDIIRNGIVPAALEMIDHIVIEAVEKYIGAGFPLDAEAVLIIELEDLKDGIEDEAERIREICRANNAREVRLAADEAERAQIWRARKEAFGALGTISPSFYTQDGVIPRSKLPEVLEEILACGKRYGFRVANVFHAGDGNLHPLIPYDSQNPKDVENVFEVGREILEICLKAGGSLSGEHGIGLEKAHMMEQVYNQDDRDNMIAMRTVFNPDDLLNPGKIFPNPSRCSETKVVRGKTGIAV
ncbi:MAG: FAD-linked oxidase C-terminal domain-containing protein [Acidobacteriota bacterium]|nr:FAD-linked oxidase C-terminal domain-containing protein [Acidobacteriota bacterium]